MVVLLLPARSAEPPHTRADAGLNRVQNLADGGAVAQSSFVAGLPVRMSSCLQPSGSFSAVNPSQQFLCALLTLRPRLSIGVS